MKCNEVSDAGMLSLMLALLDWKHDMLYYHGYLLGPQPGKAKKWLAA
jgi:hypothetical protein